MGYNNSAKAKMIRVAADEKDKKFASAAGKKRLDKDISDQIGGKTTPAQKKGSMAYMSASQERKDLNKMPGSYKEMGDAPIMMKGSFMSKHCSLS